MRAGREPDSKVLYDRPLILFAIVAASCLAVFCSETRAAAERSDPDSSAVQQASYSTGASGSRLKWLPQRAAKQRAVAIASDAAEPNDSCGPSCGGVRTVQDQQPTLDDLDAPLDDGKPFPPPPNGSPNGKPAPAGPNNGAVKTPPRSTLLEQELGSRQFSLKQGCPSPKDLKHITELNTNIMPSDGDLPRDCTLGDDVFQPRSFTPITFTWTASALCHKPLYFEDVQLERYGHMAGPWLQPFASAANFFCTFPILPYKMGLETPNECLYTLGYYRSGSCAPYLFDPLPLSIRAGLFEAGAWVGACAILP